MKVVFLEEVEGTARTGDVKNVADGFARNFLLPRKLAAPATQHYITIADARATKEAKKQDRLDEEAKTHLLPKVDGQAYTTEVRVGDEGKLFGSVSARDIAELVQQGTGIEVEHRQIDLKEPIRELGSYDITVKLTRNVLATVSLSVEPIGGTKDDLFDWPRTGVCIDPHAHPLYPLIVGGSALVCGIPGIGHAFGFDQHHFTLCLAARLMPYSLGYHEQFSSAERNAGVW